MKDKINEIKELLKCLSGEKPCTNCYLSDKAHEEGTFCINLIAEMTLDLLNEIQEKIENGKMVSFKFNRKDKVFFTDYIQEEYECPHCGKTCYKEIVSCVASGWVEERILTENQDGREILYSIKIDDTNEPIKWFTKRKEEDLFLTKELAEQKLKELKGEV